MINLQTKIKTKFKHRHSIDFIEEIETLGHLYESAKEELDRGEHLEQWCSSINMEEQVFYDYTEPYHEGSKPEKVSITITKPSRTFRDEDELIQACVAKLSQNGDFWDVEKVLN